MKEILKKNRSMIIAVVLSLIIGVGFGRYATPEKVVIKTKNIEVERIVTVEKKVFIKQEIKKTAKKKHVITKKITKPDGTIVEEKIESEEDVTFADSTEKEATDLSNVKEKTTIKEVEKTTKYNTKKVQVSVLVGTSALTQSKDPFDFTGKYQLTYGVHATYQFLGPVSVGGYGISSGEFGVSVGFTF